MRRARTRLVALLALMLQAGPVLPGASPSAPSPSDLSERATVELVLIEVYVNDSHGRPVRNLSADNFALSVDAHAKPIHSVEFREGIPGARFMIGETPTAGETASGRRLPSSLPRRFVLFFEDGTSGVEGLTTARKAVERLLDGGLLPTDEVALASFDRRLHILHDFTIDRAALVQSIEDTLKNVNRFSDHAADQAQYDREMGELTSMSRGGPEPRVLLLATNYAEEFTPRSRDVLRALSTLVDSLAPYPGYKAIVFMGDGVAENPAVDFLQRFGSGDRVVQDLRGARKYDLSQEIGLLAQAASAAGVTLHSLQTSGQSSTTGIDMHATGRRTNALETLALNTGGTRSTSNDLFKGLTEAEEAGRAYYVIGYVPEGPPDGLYHTVQIRLKHADGTVRWRRGFTRLRPEEARQRAVEAAYLLPELYPDLGVEISVVPGPAGGTARVIDLVVHLPPGRAVFVPRPGGAAARLESGFVALDGAAHQTARAAREALIRLTDASAQDRLGIDFYSRIRLPLDAQTITAVVSDREAGTFGAARVTVPPASLGGSTGTFGLSLYSMSEKSLWVEIPTAGPSSSTGEGAADYTIGPSLKSTFRLGERLACGFRLAGAAPRSALRLLIRDGDREIRSVEVAKAAAAGGGPGAAPSITTDLPLEGLPAGDYQVVVRSRDDGGDEKDRGSTPLRLRAPADGAGT